MTRGYEDMTDEEILLGIREGDDSGVDFLLEKYKNLVRKKARALYLIGGDNDDLIQEGMIGLYKAIRDFQPDREASFAHFATLCVERQLYNAVKGANRLKNSPLNSYVSLDVPVGSAEYPGENRQTLGEMLEKDGISNPEDIMIDRERVGKIERTIRENLSGFEQSVVNLYIEGMNYQQIATELGKTPKSIDNALQRIKKKLSELC
nr:RNA polymerase sporulation sigma factor SigH [Eubacterium sp.]